MGGTPLGRFGDHVGSFGELLGRSGSFWGALWGCLWELLSDFGMILGAFWEHVCLQDQIYSLIYSLLSTLYIIFSLLVCCVFEQLFDITEVLPTRELSIDLHDQRLRERQAVAVRSAAVRGDAGSGHGG